MMSEDSVPSGPSSYVWHRTPWWDWHRYVGKTWRIGDEVYNPFEYQTDRQRALEALEEHYGRPKLGEESCLTFD